MILIDVKKYIKDRSSANLHEISYHFRKDPDVIRGMLESLVRKGNLDKIQGSTHCGRGCIGCNAADIEEYRWIHD